MDRITLFVDVLLPLPVPGTFTYRVPMELNDAVGKWKRVVVQFGKKKVYTAVVVNVHEKPPASHAVKYILAVIDAEPVMNKVQHAFWSWMSEYYMCEPGEVMHVAFPSALKLASETRITLNPDYAGGFDHLPEKEYLVAEALDIQKKLTITEVEHIVEQRKVIPLIKSLLEKDIIKLEEELRERYKPKTETFIRLTEEYSHDSTLQPLFTELESRAFRQLEVLMAFISMSGFGKGKPKPVLRTELLKKVKSGASALSALQEKRVLEPFKATTTRLEDHQATAEPADIKLTEEQSAALESIRFQWVSNRVVLFHGVTSSGKTEIYIKLIAKALKKGQQVLYLLPEIALTTQIINRLRKYFGNQVGVYHSRYSENERVEIWNQVLNG